MPTVTGISLGASKIAAKSLNHTAVLVKALLWWAVDLESLLGTLPQWAPRGTQRHVTAHNGIEAPCLVAEAAPTRTALLW